MKTRKKQIEQNFQNIKDGSLVFAWEFDPCDTPFIIVAKKENDKIYARIKGTNSGVIVLDGYRKQSDIVREFVKKIGKVAFEMHLTAKDAYQGRNQADAQQAYGAMDAIKKLMAQIIVLAEEYGAEVEE